MSTHTEDRLETSLVLMKMKKREPSLTRQLSALITRIIRHQDQVILGLQKRNDQLERMHRDCKHPDYSEE